MRKKLSKRRKTKRQKKISALESDFPVKKSREIWHSRDFLCGKLLFLQLELHQHLLKGVEHVVDILVRDDERRLERHDVSGDAVLADDEAAIFKFFEHHVQLFGGGTLVAVYEFCARHEAEAADVADDRVAFLDLGESLAQLFAARLSIFGEAMLLDVVEDSESGRA